MKFPLWHYLRQPVFSAQQSTIFSPIKFQRQRQVRHLEQCWTVTYRPEEQLP
ncbi:hypothetical protein IQ241_11555 [Romeria aff. gracilis LEGE 07310]|uniref:Uncharacterized protein n=1 Tax=Vasconcelosia minhoensis LEGE 07310 TaxID=915328 RepID=A0A8J7ADE6_9CYAN|nr:hypothetical protein [Romeria gracilis]MBE9077921.1 hypothetical protein [Romeria aff. gracilis LEGE 07310]